MSSKVNYYCLSNPNQNEIDGFYNLYLSCFDEDPTKKWSKKGFEDILSLEGVEAHLCSTNGDLSGFIIWRETCEESEILNIGVRAGDRKNGIGSDLIEGSVSAMKEKQIKKIFLEVREGNESAQSLYKAKGFEITGKRKAYYSHQAGGREDAVLMTKLL